MKEIAEVEKRMVVTSVNQIVEGPFLRTSQTIIHDSSSNILGDATTVRGYQLTLPLRYFSCPQLQGTFYDFTLEVQRRAVLSSTMQHSFDLLAKNMRITQKEQTVCPYYS